MQTCDRKASAQVPEFDATVCQDLAGFPAEGPDAVNSTTRCKPGLIPDEAVAPPPVADTPAPASSNSESAEVSEKDLEGETKEASLVSSTAVSPSLVMLAALLCVLL